jgi:hypothetical protein
MGMDEIPSRGHVFQLDDSTQKFQDDQRTDVEDNLSLFADEKWTTDSTPPSCTADAYDSPRHRNSNDI